MLSKNLFSDAKSSDSKAILPPQIANRLLANGNYMSDEAIQEVKAAIQRIYQRNAAKSSDTKNEYDFEAHALKNIAITEKKN